MHDWAGMGGAGKGFRGGEPGTWVAYHTEINPCNLLITQLIH